MAVTNAVDGSTFNSISLTGLGLSLSLTPPYCPKLGNKATDYQLLALHFLYGKNLERALRIVDLGGVKRILGEPSGWALFLVVGESKRKEEYICFPTHHSACYSFYDVVNRAEQLCCKHQLAARFAEALRAYTEVRVPDEVLSLMLSRL